MSRGVKYLDLERKEAINIDGGKTEDNNSSRTDATNHNIEELIGLLSNFLNFMD